LRFFKALSGNSTNINLNAVRKNKPPFMKEKLKEHSENMNPENEERDCTRMRIFNYFCLLGSEIVKPQ